jgi:hypothetical protein
MTTLDYFLLSAAFLLVVLAICALRLTPIL